MNNSIKFEITRLIKIFEATDPREMPYQRTLMNQFAAEYREQLRLLETITAEAQADYFDPRAPAQRDLDQWQDETAQTNKTERPL